MKIYMRHVFKHSLYRFIVHVQNKSFGYVIVGYSPFVVHRVVSLLDLTDFICSLDCICVRDQGQLNFSEIS